MSKFCHAYVSHMSSSCVLHFFQRSSLSQRLSTWSRSGTLSPRICSTRLQLSGQWVEPLYAHCFKFCSQQVCRWCTLHSVTLITTSVYFFTFFTMEFYIQPLSFTFLYDFFRSCSSCTWLKLRLWHQCCGRALYKYRFIIINVMIIRNKLFIFWRSEFGGMGKTSIFEW